MPAVRMVERLRQLADHLDARLDRQAGAWLGPAGARPAARGLLGHELVEPLPCGAVPEYDRRPGLVLLAELLGLDDALVRDALQGEVLAPGGPPRGIAFGLGGIQVRQVDPDSPDLVAGQCEILREVILPGRPGVEGPGRQLKRADLAVLAQPPDAYLL